MKKMNEKKYIKIAIIALTFLPIIINMIGASVFATAPNLEQYNPQGGNGAGTQKITEYGKTITGIVQFVGVFILFATFIFLGVSYVAAPEAQKGKIKEDSIRFLMAAMFIIGGFFVVKTVTGIVGSLGIK